MTAPDTLPPLPDDDDALEDLLRAHLDPVRPSAAQRARTLSQLPGLASSRPPEQVKGGRRPSPFGGENRVVPHDLSQLGGDALPSPPRRRSKLPLVFVFASGLAAVAAVGVGGSVVRARWHERAVERWLGLSDADPRAKLQEGERLAPELRADRRVARALVRLRVAVAAEARRAKAFTELARPLTLDERKAICDRALAQDPGLAEVWLERARVRFELDRRAAADAGGSEPREITRGAREDLEGALDRDAGLVEAYLLRAELSRFENDGRAMLADLRWVEELDPAGALGRLAQGRKEELSRRYSDALVHYDRALELDPKLVAAYLGRARVYVTQGTYSKAIASADQATKLAPESSEAQALLAEARYFASGRSDRGALRVLDRALELDPSNSEALALRAYVRLERGTGGQVISSPAMCRRAVEDAERANAIRPEVRACLALAEVALWQRGDTAQAASYAKQAIELDGRGLDAFLLRSQIRILAGEYEEADRDLERALTLAESRPNTDEVTARALTMRAAIRIGNKDYDAAKDLLRRAIKLQGDLAEAHFYYAKALHHDPKRQAGDWRIAEQEYSKAISLDGTLADAWFHRGALHVDRSRGNGSAKEWEEGLDDLDKAEELQRSRFGAFFKPYYLDLMRGVAYHGLQDWERAQQHLQRFLEEASPGEDNYALAKKLLREVEGQLGAREAPPASEEERPEDGLRPGEKEK